MSLVDGSTFFVRHQPSLLGKLWTNAKETIEWFLDFFYDAELNNPCGADAVEVEEALCIAGDNDGQQGGAQQPVCGDALVTRPEEDCDPAALNLLDRLCFANNPNLANPDNAPPFWLCPSVANPTGGEACKCDRAPSLSSSAASAASSASSCGGFAPDASVCRNGSCPPGQRCTLIPAHTDPLYSDFDECGCAPSVSPPSSLPPRRPLPPQIPQKKIPQFCCGKAPTWTTCGGPRSIGNSSSWMAGVPEHERRYYYSCFDICNVLFGQGTHLASFCRRNLVYDNLAECNRACFQASVDENARVCRKSSISSTGQRSPVMCSFGVGGGEDGTWSSSSAPAGGSLRSASSPSSRSPLASSLSSSPPGSSMEPVLGSSRGAVSPPSSVFPSSRSSLAMSSVPFVSSVPFSSSDVSSGGSAPWLSSPPSSVFPSSRSSLAMSSVPFVSSVPFPPSSGSSRAPLSSSSVSAMFSFSSFPPLPPSSVSSHSASSASSWSSTSSRPSADSSAPSASPASSVVSASSASSWSSTSSRPSAGSSAVSSRSAGSGPSAGSSAPSASPASSVVLVPFVPTASSVSFLPPMEVLRQLPPGQIAHVLVQLPPREAAELFAQFPVQQQQEILQAMPPEWRGKLLARTALSACGSGRVEEDEECDDGNLRDFDGCTSDCRLERGVCGDGVVQSLLGEQCEPSLSAPDAAMRCLRCRLVSQLCGDGKIDLGEECDDGPGNTMTPNTRCRPDCGYARCGDGVLDSLLEQCDDEDRLPGDGCDSSCRREISTLPPSSLAFPPSTRLPSSLFQGQDYSWQTRRLPRQTTETGPELLAIMAAGAAGGWAWMRRRSAR